MYFTKTNSPRIPSLYENTRLVLSEKCCSAQEETSASAQEKGKCVTDIRAAALFVEASHPVVSLGTKVNQLKFYNRSFEHLALICQQLCSHSADSIAQETVTGFVCIGFFLDLQLC